MLCFLRIIISSDSIPALLFFLKSYFPPFPLLHLFPYSPPIYLSTTLPYRNPINLLSLLPPTPLPRYPLMCVYFVCFLCG